MAVKEAELGKRQWRDPLFWRDRLPLEVRIHQRNDQNRSRGGGRGHESLVEHRGYRLMMRQRRFRIYMDYYEGGTLRQAVSDSFELRAQRPDIPQRAGHNNIVHLDAYGNRPEILPEGFIWWILGSLVEACQVLQYGQALDTNGSKPDWQPITHLDIRMDNILLQPRPIRQNGVHPVCIAAPHMFSLLITRLLTTIVSPCCPGRLWVGNLPNLGRLSREPSRIPIGRKRCQICTSKRHFVSYERVELTQRRSTGGWMTRYPFNWMAEQMSDECNWPRISFIDCNANISVALALSSS